MKTRRHLVDDVEELERKIGYTKIGNGRFLSSHHYATLAIEFGKREVDQMLETIKHRKFDSLAEALSFFIIEMNKRFGVSVWRRYGGDYYEDDGRN